MSDGHLSLKIEASKNVVEDGFDLLPRTYPGYSVEITLITSEISVVPNDVDTISFQSDHVVTVSSKASSVAHVDVTVGEFRRRWLLRVLILAAIFMAYLAAIVSLLRSFPPLDVVDNGSLSQSLLKVVHEHPATPRSHFFLDKFLTLYVRDGSTVSTDLGRNSPHEKYTRAVPAEAWGASGAMFCGHLPAPADFHHTWLAPTVHIGGRSVWILLGIASGVGKKTLFSSRVHTLRKREECGLPTCKMTGLLSIPSAEGSWGGGGLLLLRTLPLLAQRSRTRDIGQTM